MVQDIQKNERNDRVTPTGSYDPFSAMRGEIDRIFDSFIGRRPGDLPTLFQSREFTVMPSMDVTENEQALLIDAELPGLAQEDIDVSLRDGVLTIQGEKKSERDETKDNVHLTERTCGRFRRTFRVPDTIDQEAIEAAMDNGVLHIKLPKQPDAQQPEKKIKIGKSNGGRQAKS